MRKLIIIFLALFSLTAGNAQTSKLRKNANKIFLSNSFTKTEQILQSASQKAKSAGKKEIFIWFQLLLGENYQRNGYFVDAEKAFNNALEESRASLPLTNNHYYLDRQQSQKTYFDAFDNMGFFYLAMGNLTKSEELFKESKSLREAYFSKNNVHRAMPLAGLGGVAYKKKNFLEAYEYFSQALEILKKTSTTGYNFDLVYRHIYNDLVEICLATGKTKEAQEYLELLALSSSSISSYGSRVARNTETTRIFDLYARNKLINGDFRKAQQYIDRASDFTNKNQTASLINFKLQLTQARIYWLTNDLTQAAASFKSLMKSYRDYIASNFSMLSEYEKEKFYYTLKDDLELFNSFVIVCHEKNLAASLNLYETVYDNQLNLKALLLGSLNKRKNLILNSENPELINLQNKLEETRSQLSASYYTKDATNEIDLLTKEVEKLDKELNRRTNFNEISSSSWKQVSSTLGNGDLAVEVVRIRNMDPAKAIPKDGKINYLFVVNSSAVNLFGFTIPNGHELESRSIKYHRNSIISQTDDDFSYDIFWKPIRQYIKSADHIYLSPDGVYSQINLNILRNPETHKFVLDEADIIYLTNTSDLLTPRKQSSILTATLVGRPSYSAQVSTNEKVSMRSLNNYELMSLKEQDFADLPGTEQEILKAESILNKSGWKVTMFKGDQATEQNLKQVKSPGVLHIATHGFFIEDSTGVINPMIRSGLLLAGVSYKNVPQSQDGILTAYEGSMLNLQDTELVVLSACETGLGEVRNGEGVYGLQRSMISAGTKNLLMSLWKVDDTATSELMGTFYQRWNSQTSAREAFKQAQLAVRKKYPHPYFWGAFIMLGN
ncbi:MAG: CHAT domain-containing protein [Cyclobacteriaceae bacterium]|nr:CHAT domain-containing protein [Cyclobacteriaceae bacterium]